MTQTAKNTTTDGPALTWSSSKDWGSVGNTYRAEADGWKYTIDQPQKGKWVLRGWGPADKFLYRDGYTTLKAAKGAAREQHGRLTKAAPVKSPAIVMVDEGAELIGKSLTAGLLKMGEAASRAADAMRKGLVPVVTTMVHGVRRSVWLNLVRPQLDGCSCPTPTHKMSCGHGARPKVVSG
jgi:hypothetical protein